jgi:hypothetical protein
MNIAAAILIRLDGRSGHLRNLSAKDKPSILGIVNKYVTVALICFNNLISAKLPGINGVKRAPLKENVYALEYLGHAVSTPIGAPTNVNVENDTGDITLYVIKRLEVRGRGITADITGSRIRSLNSRSTVGISVGLIATGAVYNCIRGTNMVQVCATAAGVSAALTLRPDMLAVPTVPLAHSSRVRGVYKKNSSVLVFTVGLIRHILTVIVAGELFVGISHKSTKAGEQLGCGLSRKICIGIFACVIFGCAGAVKSGTYHISLTRVIFLGIFIRLIVLTYRNGRKAGGYKDYNSKQSRYCTF